MRKVIVIILTTKDKSFNDFISCQICVNKYQIFLKNESIFQITVKFYYNKYLI
jgi:hypothetical protein